MKFKSTRCANIWIRTRTITTIDSYRRKEKERARFHYQYSNLRSLQPKFKPSHKLNRSVLTKLERNYSNHKYQRREGRKFFKLYSKFQFFSLSPINQGSILTRIFNINIGIIIHRYRSKKISHLLSDQFKISCERLTESRRKLDRQKIHLDTFVSTVLLPIKSLIPILLFRTFRSQNEIAPFYWTRSKSRKKSAEEKNQDFPRRR